MGQTRDETLYFLLCFVMQLHCQASVSLSDELNRNKHPNLWTQHHSKKSLGVATASYHSRQITTRTTISPTLPDSILPTLPLLYHKQSNNRANNRADPALPCGRHIWDNRAKIHCRVSGVHLAWRATLSSAQCQCIAFYLSNAIALACAISASVLSMETRKLRHKEQTMVHAWVAMILQWSTNNIIHQIK